MVSIERIDEEAYQERRAELDPLLRNNQLGSASDELHAKWLRHNPSEQLLVWMSFEDAHYAEIMIVQRGNGGQREQ